MDLKACSAIELVIELWRILDRLQGVEKLHRLMVVCCSLLKVAAKQSAPQFPSPISRR